MFLEDIRYKQTEPTFPFCSSAIRVSVSSVHWLSRACNSFEATSYASTTFTPGRPPGSTKVTVMPPGLNRNSIGISAFYRRILLSETETGISDISSSPPSASRVPAPVYHAP